MRSCTIDALKSIFSTHGIPEGLRSDNASFFMSKEFDSFCFDYGINQTTSSPQFARANGEAETAVQTVKKTMWKKAEDKHLALLDYRTTPREGLHLSPAQLLMGRRPRNKLPAKHSLLVPKPYSFYEVKRHFDMEKTERRSLNTYQGNSAGEINIKKGWEEFRTGFAKRKKQHVCKGLRKVLLEQFLRHQAGLPLLLAPRPQLETVNRCQHLLIQPLSTITTLCCYKV